MAPTGPKHQHSNSRHPLPSFLYLKYERCSFNACVARAPTPQSPCSSPIHQGGCANCFNDFCRWGCLFTINVSARLPGQKCRRIARLCSTHLAIHPRLRHYGTPSCRRCWGPRQSGRDAYGGLEGFLGVRRFVGIASWGRCPRGSRRRALARRFASDGPIVSGHAAPVPK